MAVHFRESYRVSDIFVTKGALGERIPKLTPPDRLVKFPRACSNAFRQVSTLYYNEVPTIWSLYIPRISRREDDRWVDLFSETHVP